MASWRTRLALGVTRKVFGAGGPLILGHMITLRCNLRCSFCTYWREISEGSPAEMDLPSIQRMLDDARRAGIAVYSMTGGEPLLRPDAGAALRAAGERGIFSMVITNGVLLGGRAEELVDSADLIVVSVDTLSPRTYRSLRGRNADLEGVLGNFRRCAQLIGGGGRKARLSINCVVMDQNIDELGDIARFASELGAGISFEPVVVQQLEDCPGLTMPLPELGSRLMEIARTSGNVLNTGSYLKAMAKGRRPACSADAVVRVDPRGEVVCPCYDIPDPERVGNVTETGLEGLLATEAWKRGMERARRCTRKDCWMACYTEPGLIASNPASALQDALMGMLR